MNHRAGIHRHGIYLSLRQRLFFFRAEDGIRAKLVTGVQTCALPISRHLQLRREGAQRRARRSRRRDHLRSEERRVGKSVDLGGRRIIKKKKRSKMNVVRCVDWMWMYEYDWGELKMG